VAFSLRALGSPSFPKAKPQAKMKMQMKTQLLKDKSFTTLTA
jgi:hypothetical protein